MEAVCWVEKPEPGLALECEGRKWSQQIMGKSSRTSVLKGSREMEMEGRWGNSSMMCIGNDLGSRC